MSNQPLSNLVPYTCFGCRSTYKRPFEKGVFYRKCPTCGGAALCMDIRFRPPKKLDDKQWKKVKYLVDHGFNFQKVYHKEGPIWHRERYPQNLEQAKEFVIKFKDQAYDFNII
ncbi:hypothetical protein H0A36_26525 [Endozoicomonas sp. SM1973]|uniref:Uncharacterized protein n=2 Tax=Spartinivicinus marinus TaxID=2994442 RepID=A0A853IKH1_9GAMM|nr:hypothetical protein [Spartinivicinus marinus]NYZ69575.1 hypothetical protein [Spartinivicinus marinus]